MQFARLYPLNQQDLPLETRPLDFGPLMPKNVRIENPSRDYTPPSACSLATLAALCMLHCWQLLAMGSTMTCCVRLAEYVNLLMTDLGALSPSAISDELIQLYV